MKVEKNKTERGDPPSLKAQSWTLSTPFKNVRANPHKLDRSKYTIYKHWPGVLPLSVKLLSEAPLVLATCQASSVT